MKWSALHILLFFFSFLSFAQAQSGKHTYRFYKDFKIAQPECGPDLALAQAPGSCAGGTIPGLFVDDVLPCGVKRFVYQNNPNWGFLYPNSEGLVTGTYTIQLYLKVTNWSGSRTRIIDFSNGSLDDGIYFTKRGAAADRCLDVYPNGIAGDCPFFNTSAYYLLTITRDGATDKMEVYVDNTLFTSFTDSGKNYVGKTGVPIYIFRDDKAKTCESGEARFAYLAFHDKYFSKTDVEKSSSDICFEANINPYADFSISPNPTCEFPENIEVKYTGPIPAPGTGYDFKWDWDGAKVISGSGMGPYVLSWDTGGTKYVTLTVASQACGNPLVNRKQAIISKLALTTAVTAGSCETGTNGTITLTGSEGLAPYRYSLDSVNFQSSNIFTKPAGNYRAFVRDGNDCVVAKNVSVQFASDIELRAMADTTVCEGQSVQLLAESNGQSFMWLPQTGLDDAGAREPVATPGATTQYIVTATKGFCTATDTVLVNVAPKIEVTVTPDAVIEYNVPFLLTATSPPDH
ncbi:SprB repeat-containing protein [Dyadobacter sp. 676]|uniref:SprB repeat-containing protein n=1 Tax=Dyadobacter sp. 676 TaxID=3088362 RepID=A0AAU8FMU7_9BACT